MKSPLLLYQIWAFILALIYGPSIIQLNFPVLDPFGIHSNFFFYPNPESIRKFLKEQPDYLLQNYQKMKPYRGLTKWFEVVPYHNDGQLKDDFDYHDCINESKIFIHSINSLISFDIAQNCLWPDEKIKLNPNSKLIYCLLIHAANEFLMREIAAMSYENISFIIYFDQHVSIATMSMLFKEEITFRKYTKKYNLPNNWLENVFVINQPALMGYWGSFNLPLIELILMTAAIKYFPNALYLSYHSGADYRLVSNKYILDFLESHYPDNYLIFKSRPWAPNRLDDFMWPWEKGETFMPILAHLFPNRAKPKYKFGFGSQWFTITMKDSMKILKKAQTRYDIIEFFEHTQIPDESFFQTLAAEANVTTTNNYLRYIDWKRPCFNHCPHFMVGKSVRRVLTLPCAFWARKVKLPDSFSFCERIDKIVDSRYGQCHGVKK